MEDRIRITEHFMVVMPSLLSKFKMDKDKIQGLMQIPRFFDLEYYVTGRLVCTSDVPDSLSGSGSGRILI